MESQDTQSPLSHPPSAGQTLSPDRASTRRSLPNIATVGRVVSSFQRGGKHSSSFWKSKQAYNLKWFKKWDHECFQNGRVLLIDYISRDAMEKSGNKDTPHLVVAAQEFDNMEELQAFYDDPRHALQAALRVLHVQNASWAHAFLLKQFNVDNDSELVGMKDFERWTRFDKPSLRNGKPYPTGRSWPVQIDPWRNVCRTAIGVDYIRSKESTPRQPQPYSLGDTQVLHLDAATDNGSVQGHEVGLARFAVYVQRSLGPVNDVSPKDSFKVPYVRSGWRPNGTNNAYSSKWKNQRVEFDKLDNANAIMIFEDTVSSRFHDCLIDARSELESKWRRLPFYLKKQQASDDASLAAECSNIILGDVFHALAGVWEDLLGHASEHVALLEDKIYEDPTDESKAPDLWTNQAAWLKVDKVMYLHRDILAELQGHLGEMSEDNSRREGWLATNSRELERLAHGIQEDLIQPTNNLIDLMYKSVGIRDSKQSLQLGLSMWRLSWITFIFLPLTFVVGFFSMQVDIFSDQDISVGWYFLGAGITMLLVLYLWYRIKSSLQTRRQTIYQRGLYRQLYSEVEQTHPRLWTDRGPAANIVPEGYWRKTQWWLLKRWFNPSRTINRRDHDFTADDDAGFGWWSKLKRHLLKTWLGEIEDHALALDVEAAPLVTAYSTMPSDVQTAAIDAPPAVVQLAELTTPVLVSEIEPEIVLTKLELTRRLTRGRRASSSSARNSEDRASSVASAALMVERRDLSELDSDTDEAVLLSEEDEMGFVRPSRR